MAACQKNKTSTLKVPLFNSKPDTFRLNPMIAEASGIADSKKNPGYIWIQEDSGNPSQLYLIDHKGNYLKRIPIEGATNRDWEDMTISNNQIYIAETGDNYKTASSYAFYIFSEPDKSIDTIINFEKIQFRYPDGSHDAEAFLVDPISKSIYVITKTDSLSAIYKVLPTSGSSNIQTAKFIGQLQFNGVTSASVSPNGREIILKTYTALLYFGLSGTETIESIINKKPANIPYILEPQGEAVTFASDGSGYFTLSEKGFSSKQYLYFYRKK